MNTWGNPRRNYRFPRPFRLDTSPHAAIVTLVSIELGQRGREGRETLGIPYT